LFFTTHAGVFSFWIWFIFQFFWVSDQVVAPTFVSNVVNFQFVYVLCVFIFKLYYSGVLRDQDFIYFV